MRQPSTSAFEKPFWPVAWAHAFESKVTIYQKYAWINDLSDNEYMRLTSIEPQGLERTQLDGRLMVKVPEAWRHQSYWLWHYADFPLAVCPKCLLCGYHSDVPQMLGLEHCPIHALPLQRHCKHCFQPLRFGRPRYPHVGPFSCKICGQSVVPFLPGSALSWNQAPHQRLEEVFAGYQRVCSAVANEAAGYWHFPAPWDRSDCRLVLNSISQNRLFREFATELPLFHTETMYEEVAPVTVQLPLKRSILKSTLAAFEENARAHVAKFCGGHMDRLGRHLGRALRGSSVSYDIDYSMYSNLEAILGSFEPDDLREVLLIQLPALACAEIDPSTRDQLAEALASFSVWQAFRVVLLIDNLCRMVARNMEESESFDQAELEYLETRKYGIHLHRAHLGNSEFSLNVNRGAWFAPCRIRMCGDRLEATFFQISPCLASTLRKSKET